MKLIYLLLIMFVIYGNVLASPVLKEVTSLMEEFEPEEKIREKRKSGLLDHLQADGIGVKRTVAEEVAPKEEEMFNVEIPLVVENEASDAEEESTRAKKQAHDNVCIEDMSNGGKTSCGRVISARGPAAKMLMHREPNMLQTGQTEMDPQMGRYQSMQSRTFDPLIPLTSLPSSVTYAVPSFSAADSTAALAHSLPAIAAAPALPVAPITHLESLPLISHTLPIHPMHTMFTHRPLLNLNLQRMELPKVQEIIYTPAEVKQPAYEVKPIVTRPVATTPFLYSSRYGSVNTGYDGPMICHPLGDERASQQVIQIRPEVHVIESGHKNINTSVEEFKAQLGETMDNDENKVREHLRQVNEIREEITQLNKAAQRIVDQQERLAEMQQRHIWRNSAEKQGYNDLRMYMVPPTYSRANALAYPNTMDDIEFFMNLLKAGKNLGALSNTFQPAITSALDATRVVFGDQNGQSGASQPKGNREKQDSTNGQSNNAKQNN